MRRPALYALLAAFAAGSLAPALLPTAAEAQARRGGGDDKRQPSDDEKRAAKKKRDEEWGANLGRLPGQRNIGPCPFVKVLYDAGRYIEFDGGREAAAAVGYSGEIQGITADCRYQNDEPITVDMTVGFAFGKGPRAQGSEKSFTYWVAVTRRNQEIIGKEYFTVPVKFAPGQDRAIATDRLAGIVIPRADNNTSGSNFEILVGFDVTPQMAAFNRDGKRFRVDVAPVQAAAAGTTGAQ
jgi:hypothetical protein